MAREKTKAIKNIRNIMPIFTTSLEYENSEARWSTNICVRGVMVVKAYGRRVPYKFHCQRHFWAVTHAKPLDTWFVVTLSSCGCDISSDKAKVILPMHTYLHTCILCGTHFSTLIIISHLLLCKHTIVIAFRSLKVCDPRWPLSRRDRPLPILYAADSA